VAVGANGCRGVYYGVATFADFVVARGVCDFLSFFNTGLLAGVGTHAGKCCWGIVGMGKRKAAPGVRSRFVKN